MKKATGTDNLSGKILKLAKPALLSPIADFINLSIQTSTIPDRTKLAQVTPLHKKNDPMDKTNFRPVSVLTAVSKFYENTISEKLSLHFENIFDQNL